MILLQDEVDTVARVVDEGQLLTAYVLVAAGLLTLVYGLMPYIRTPKTYMIPSRRTHRPIKLSRRRWIALVIGGIVLIVGTMRLLPFLDIQIFK